MVGLEAPEKYRDPVAGDFFSRLAGLPNYLELSYSPALAESICDHVHVRDKGQGGTDREMVTSLIFLNLDVETG
jgi:hypothetical protein